MRNYATGFGIVSTRWVYMIAGLSGLYPMEGMRTGSLEAYKDFLSLGFWFGTMVSLIVAEFFVSLGKNGRGKAE